MKNSKAAAILFEVAREALDAALEKLSEYNIVADALGELGYCEPDDGCGPRPVPMLNLTSGCIDYYDSDFLDEFLSRGPIPMKPTGGLMPARRFAVVSRRNKLGEESGWVCFYCARKGDERNGPDGRVWHVDHAYPVVRGGDDHADNLVLACATCNLEKKDRTVAEYLSAKK